MRNLSEKDKHFIETIISSNIELCSIISKEFTKNKYALLLDRDKAHLLIKNTSEKDDIFSILVQYASLLKQLEEEGYIYTLEDKFVKSCLIQNSTSKEIWIADGQRNCHLGIIEEKNGCFKITRDEEVYEELQISDSFSYVLYKMLLTRAYPSNKLKELKKNEYLPEEAVKYKKNYIIALTGLIISIVALFVSIGAPFWMTSYNTNYNNKHAISTIDSTQLKSINKRLDVILERTDSIFLISQKTDTVYVINDSFIKKTSINKQQ